MFKVLDEACTPTKGSKFSACIDLRASEDVVIGAGETKMVGLGVCIDIDMNTIDYNFNHYTKKEQNRVKENFLKSHYLQLMLRSSLGKKGLILPNGVGVIDLDYRDEIKMIIHNPIMITEHTINHDITHKGVDDNRRFVIKQGDRIGQMTLLEHKSYLFGIDTEEERSGGFGSTDKDHYDLKENEQDGRNL